MLKEKNLRKEKEQLKMISGIYETLGKRMLNESLKCTNSEDRNKKLEKASTLSEAQLIIQEYIETIDKALGMIGSLSILEVHLDELQKKLKKFE